MKKGIHPEITQSVITCICGEQFTTTSSKDQVRIEICSKCHPYYTGEQARIIDTAGRVDRFNRRYGLKSD